MFTRLVRKNILQVSPYIAGKPIEETKRELKLREVIKLASNENPLGPSPKAVAALVKALPGVHRYPDSNSFYLKKALARYYSLLPAQFCVGNGSDELIDTIIKTFVEDDENIVTADVTFLEYAVIAKTLSRQVITVPLERFAYNLEALRQRITRKTKVVFIANPNNPTGTYVGESQLRKFLMGLPASVIVVLDEAYDLFVDARNFASGVAFVSRHPVIVLKTFSKAFGLAGLRLGCAIAHPKLITYLEKARQPFNVNSLAQAAGCAALLDKEFLLKTRECVLAGKAYLYQELDKIGVPYIPSVANFILFDVGRDSLPVFRLMLKKGVIVRDMKQYGLHSHIRVTVGTSRENERFMYVLKQVLGK